jgi:RHH-type proline utilization regulon transcriptional repressor/proline dehydrogenase/delta 1-pyrroline-5-carboxylate dehydrogenase
MLVSPELARTEPLRRRVREGLQLSEAQVVEQLLPLATLPAESVDRVQLEARRLVEAVRKARLGHGGLDAFLHEFQLSSKEGVVLLCLAEALLRVPDTLTVDKLIRDKIGEADWRAHLGKSESLFVNASTWALMLTGRVLQLDERDRRDLGGTLRRLVTRSGEPVIRAAMHQAMRILGKQFVMGRTIEEALERAGKEEERGYRHSFDMLGEGARTLADADRYLASYLDAIAAIGRHSAGRGPIEGPGISVKLSALHPRYEEAQRDRALSELKERILRVATGAKAANIGMTIDAEEASRLDLSLDLIEALALAPELKGWQGLGLALQAYQKRAILVLDWLAALGKRSERRLFVRLVKGAYWDSEIKWAQEQGLDHYPVFTRKTTTDVSYQACLRKMLSAPEAIYPAFATHNALSVATVLELAGNRRDFEFQRLHGMGEALYDEIVGPERLDRPCRIYAPVGSHEDLLAYLVRRLLENGANSSFVNRIQDERLPVEEMVADPVARTRRLSQAMHPRIALPRELYGRERLNSRGLDLNDPLTLVSLGQAMEAAARQPWRAAPLVGGRERAGPSRPIRNPADTRQVVGEVVETTPAAMQEALDRASKAQPAWNETAAEERAEILERLADLLEERRAELMALCVKEAGKTAMDAQAEVREAADFCRYYAHRARVDFAQRRRLPGPTGEANEIALHGRGTFLCISPWNFPLAIFLGQVTAALAAGNAAIAKPAEQTPLIAAAAVRLALQAGVPPDVLHLLPGDGPTVGQPLVADTRIAGVAFTGSTEVARKINQTLANRDGPIVPLIAETGGQNAMIVDSTALPEQVVRDVLSSAAQSAGQRCSALRVLFVQQDVAEKMLRMLSGAMAELKVGDPSRISTDVGPVIDEEAKSMLEGHSKRLKSEGRLIAETPLPKGLEHGHFVAPVAFQLDSLSQLQKEIFGPVLHVVRFRGDRLDQVIEQINATGYGLTLGIHTRIDATAEEIAQRVRAGNIYVNRNMIGAVVGVQPFGGEGLSGTGPKAGGPRYLHRFAVERVTSRDTTAAGGNASLMSLSEEGGV